MVVFANMWTCCCSHLRTIHPKMIWNRPWSPLPVAVGAFSDPSGRMPRCCPGCCTDSKHTIPLAVMNYNNCTSINSINTCHQCCYLKILFYHNLLNFHCKINLVCKNHTNISYMKILQKIEIF